MDTNKIREAVELLEAADPLNAERVAERIDEVSAIIRAELDKAQHPAEPVEMAASLSISEGLQARIDRVNKLLEARSSQAQQPGNVLTDDKVDKAVRTFVDGGLASPIDGVLPRFAVFIRDNGYLAPAAGLTVEEVMELANKLPFKWDNGGAYVYISALRARLTAAIEAKASK